MKKEVMEILGSLGPRNHGSTVAGVSAVLILMSASAFGTALVGNGQDNLGGTVTVTLAGITFAGCTTSAPDTGPFSGNSSCSVQNLAGAPNLTPDVIDFTTFTGTTPVSPVLFDLLTFSPGTGTLANCSNDTVGSVCTLGPTNPLTLSQTSSGVTITLAGQGEFYTGTSGTNYNAASPGTVLFTSQNTIPGTITTILTQLESGSSIEDSYSATYTVSAPEPATLFFTGAGLLALGLVRRRKLQK